MRGEVFLHSPPHTAGRAVGAVLAAAVLGASLAGCGLVAPGLRFTAVDGGRVAVRAHRRERPEAAAARTAELDRASLAPQYAVFATALFELAKPVYLEPGQAVALEVESELDHFTVELYRAAGNLAHAEQIRLGGAGPIRYHVAIRDPLLLWGLRVRAPPEAGPGTLKLRAAGVAGHRGGLFVNGATLLAGSGLAPRTAARFDGRAVWPVDLEVAPWQYPAPEQPWLLALQLDNAAESDGSELRITLQEADEAAGRRAAFTLTLRPGRQFVHLHGAEVGFRPRRVHLQAAAGAPATGLVSAAVEVQPGGAGSDLVAKAADLSTVLALPPTTWRQPAFELYAWNAARVNAAAPVLIFDTASYAVQARFFRRLAFYVEKQGYRGRLLTDAELGSRRGYNAHDYAAADLARFFTEVQSSGVALTAEERRLRGVALTHGVISIDPNGGWSAVAGAVLSISQESGAPLRRLLLAHEVLHGLYFTHPEYRAQVLALWQQLSADEQTFWRLLLATVGYDVDHQFLVVNEFQAYLLQQDTARVANFLGLWSGRLRARHPEQARVISAVGGAVERWRAAHRTLAAALAATSGVHGTQLSLLNR